MAASRLLYLAYGSNLHPVRLVERVPSAKLIGTTDLPGLRLAFHKRSVDASGKCAFVETERGADAICCAVYELDPDEKDRLDRIEGLGDGYDEQQMAFELDDVTLRGFIYRAAKTHIDTSLLPYHWYREMVLLGSLYHGFAPEYTQLIAGVRSIEDRDIGRAASNEKILQSMRRTSLSAGRDIDVALPGH